MALLDPPYYRIIDKDWDKQWSSEDDYLFWCNQWTTECVRVLKPNSVIAVWGTTKTDTFLKYKLNVLNGLGLNYLGWCIWSYEWGGKPRNNFARKHEDCLIYYKGDNWTFNADDVRVPYKMKKNIRETAQNNPKGKIPTFVWEKNNHTTSKEYVGWHPTQKPLLVLERLIKAYTNEGEIVVDCFSGSGSTAIACDRTGRNFIGCDSSKEYVERSIERRKMFQSISTSSA
jgi:site-specific DNA-methyltransferase (adenine-specific)